jgi:SAM-dependent methyltransferase
LEVTAVWNHRFQTLWPNLPPAQRSEGGQLVSDAKFRSIAETIVRLADIRPEDRVLDLGCSIGAITYALSHHGRGVVGVDLVADSIDYARSKNSAPNVEYVCADLATFELGGPFECIVLNNVIHMLDSWAIVRRLLRRCYDELTPSGRLYLGEVPDTRKMWRFATAGKAGLRCYAHELLPGWSFPAVSRALGRPVAKVLWYNPRRLARILGCPPGRVTTHDRPGDLLNPIERSHFVVEKA